MLGTTHNHARFGFRKYTVLSKLGADGHHASVCNSVLVWSLSVQAVP